MASEQAVESPATKLRRSKGTSGEAVKLLLTYTCEYKICCGPGAVRKQPSHRFPRGGRPPQKVPAQGSAKSTVPTAVALVWFNRLTARALKEESAWMILVFQVELEDATQISIETPGARHRSQVSRDIAVYRVRSEQSELCRVDARTGGRG